MLYIVSTPIWNLEDITLRALRILKEVDYIACEDTRNTWILLKHFDIKKPLLSYHSYSWVTKLDKIISLLKEAKDIALVSDAWTPWISDPGYPLIQEALKNDIKIVPIPWVSAFLTALQASWLPINHFLYLWFLPIKKWRQTLMKRLQLIKNPQKQKVQWRKKIVKWAYKNLSDWTTIFSDEEIWNFSEIFVEETVVFYESVHRIEKTLKELWDYLWLEKNIVIARELTKKFEEFTRTNIKEAIEIYSKKEKQKWEFVIIL